MSTIGTGRLGWTYWYATEALEASRSRNRHYYPPMDQWSKIHRQQEIFLTNVQQCSTWEKSTAYPLKPDICTSANSIRVRKICQHPCTNQAIAIQLSGYHFWTNWVLFPLLKLHHQEFERVFPDRWPQDHYASLLTLRGNAAFVHRTCTSSRIPTHGVTLEDSFEGGRGAEKSWSSIEKIGSSEEQVRVKVDIR